MGCSGKQQHWHHHSHSPSPSPRHRHRPCPWPHREPGAHPRAVLAASAVLLLSLACPSTCQAPGDFDIQGQLWGTVSQGSYTRSFLPWWHKSDTHTVTERPRGVVRVGEDLGWTMRYYEPMTVLVGDVLNFSHVEVEEEGIGGHNVWLMPSREAYDACNFLEARPLGSTHAPVLFRLDRTGEYFFACAAMDGAHCAAGHKVEVAAVRGRYLRSRSKAWNPEDAATLAIAFKNKLAAERKAKRAGAAAQGAITPQQTVPLPWCAADGNLNLVDYSAATAFARFDMYGCTGVSGIHAQQLWTKAVVVIDRTDTINSQLKLPNGDNAYGSELKFGSKDPTYPLFETPLNVVTNVFCSAGQLLPDGAMVSIGGSTDAVSNSALLNGSFSIRRFRGPCNATFCSFDLVQNMTSRRWYPTAQIMPDGRVLIVGGSNTTGNIAINKPSNNNPTIEYHPRAPGEGNHYLPFLDATVPYNLYAFVHLLPSGKVFIFAGSQYTLFNPMNNQEIPGTYPSLDTVHDLDPAPVMRSYPISGTSSMFPLDPSNGYEAEIMICGGSSTLAIPINGGSQKDSIKNINFFADYMCYRIKPESKNVTWIPEPMCDTPACGIKYRRVMGDAVLLSDGNLLIINGAQQGFQGLTTAAFGSGYGRSPQFQPLIYNTATHTWYDVTKLPANKVPRLYHASALLIHDASVLISGSNPNTQKLWPKGMFPTEYRVERFVPPYLTTNLAKPNITSAPKAVTVNTLFAVYFTATQTSAVDLTLRFTAFLHYPGFSTHNQRHGMRAVKLVLAQIARIKQSQFVGIFYAPPSLNLAPPTMYWFHLLDNGIPQVEAMPMNVTRSQKASSKLLTAGTANIS